MTTKPPLTLVFDLDGTLVDTAPDLIAAANHALAGLGVTPVDAAILQPQISHGGRRILRTALEVRGIPPTDSLLDSLVEQFLDSYGENISRHSRPFPAAVKTLEHWRRQGARLAVCTNKRQHHAVQLLDALGLSRLFLTIAGRDTFAVCKPHPEHLLATIRGAGGDRQRAIMIGDSATDIEAARAAAVPSIGVSFGYTDVAMADLGADLVIDHFDQLSTAIGRLDHA